MRLLRLRGVTGHGRAGEAAKEQQFVFRRIWQQWRRQFRGKLWRRLKRRGWRRRTMVGELPRGRRARPPGHFKAVMFQSDDEDAEMRKSCTRPACTYTST